MKDFLEDAKNTIEIMIKVPFLDIVKAPIQMIVCYLALPYVLYKKWATRNDKDSLLF